MKKDFKLTAGRPGKDYTARVVETGDSTKVGVMLQEPSRSGMPRKTWFFPAGKP